MTIFDRPSYMATLEGYIGTPPAKVLTGIRRGGKSTLLSALSDRLVQRGVPPERIIHLDFDEYENAPLATADALNAHIVGHAPAEGPYSVLLDEIQEVAGWEKVVNSLIAHGRADVYLTGSNSRLLSGELATYIAGRYVAIHVAPLSFAEYLSFTQETGRYAASTRDAFSRYLRYGGFPGLFGAEYSDRQSQELLLDTYQAILLRDVIARRQIRSPELFRRVALFALDNVGNTFSAKRVSDYLKAQGKSLTHQTVADYLDAMVDAFLLHKVTRYDLRGRAHLQTQEKYYAGDHGLIIGALGFSQSRVPGVLENVVCNELRHRGYDVAIGKLGDAEVDFVASRYDDKIYVQVCTTALDPTTYRRELAPLLAIKDSYPKYLLTLDTLASGNTQGVKSMYLPDFLLAQGWSE